MGIEQLAENRISIVPGPFDVHMHPRATDPITEDSFVEINGGIEGKAGLASYSLTALKSGITGGLAMPNEMLRKYDETVPEKTVVVPFPISNIDRVHTMQVAITSASVIPVGVIAGIDPEEIFADNRRQIIDYDIAEARFREIQGDITAGKLWCDYSTGGFNVDSRFAGGLAERFFAHNPNKPLVIHAEDENVGVVLNNIYQIKDGKDMPIHIAHVSSRQELQAVIDAKRLGMNVTCEVTIHHLFLDDNVPGIIGGYGCVKPGLKPKADQKFLWENLNWIDMFASDCAPHRVSDKENDTPTPGFSTHTVMLPLLLGAVADGRLSYEDLYQKFCIKPRERFNRPINDGSEVTVELDRTSAEELEFRIRPKYGQNPFLRVAAGRKIGRVISAKAGKSTSVNPRTSYTHVLRPKGGSDE